MGKRKKKEEEKKQQRQRRLVRGSQNQPDEVIAQPPPLQSSSSNPSPASIVDPAYVPPPEQARVQQEVARGRRPSPLTDEQKEYLRQYSSDFKIAFSLTWKAMPQEIKATMLKEKAQIYFKNQIQRHHQNKTPRSIDPFVQQELEDFNVASPNRNQFAVRVQESLSDSDLKRFLEQRLEEYLARVQVINEYKKNQKIMKEVPPEHKFIFAV